MSNLEKIEIFMNSVTNELEKFRVSEVKEALMSCF